MRDSVGKEGEVDLTNGGQGAPGGLVPTEEKRKHGREGSPTGGVVVGVGSDPDGCEAAKEVEAPH